MTEKYEMNEKIVLTVEDYDRIDGRNANRSAVKRLVQVIARYL